nr:hypothetical protein CFP56_11095 [Quercus suber]
MHECCLCTESLCHARFGLRQPCPWIPAPRSATWSREVTRNSSRGTWKARCTSSCTPCNISVCWNTSARSRALGNGPISISEGGITICHIMADVVQPEEDQLVTYGQRSFCRFSLLHNISCVPVDEAEERRYHRLNQMLHALFDGPVISPAPFPIKDRKSRAIEEPLILDCGHGKGAWIDSLLADYEDGDLQTEYETEFQPEVIGIDIFLGEVRSDDEEDDVDNDRLQEYTPKRWNLNAPFRQDRSESRLRPESFDLINCRLLAEGIAVARWQPLVEELRKLLKPGRWMQIVEIEYLVLSRNESLPITSWLRKWWSHYTLAMVRMGKNPRIGAHLGRLMETAGCEHVSAGCRNVPLGAWQAGMLLS